MQLERKGKATVTIITEPFTALARSQAAGLELPSLPVVIIPHPISGLSPDQARQRLDGRLDDLTRVLTEGWRSLSLNALGKSNGGQGPTLEGVEIDDTLGAFDLANDLFYDKGWTDGLPIVPPTDFKVEGFLKAWGRDPNTLVGVVPPAYGLATLEKIAINMVMAGCRPEHLPVIEGSLRAMLEDRFCLITALTSTGMQAPLVIVSGPARLKLGMNSGINALGQGCRANATIGRAMRLIFVNIGGAVPGVLDRSTQGSPAKYSYVLAENQEASPWPPLHTDYGLERDDSAVTVVSGQPPCLIHEEGASDGLDLLHAVCSAMAVPDSINFNRFGDQVLVLCPEHAATLAADGYSKDDIRRYIWENARVPVTAFSRQFIEKQGRWRFAKRFNLDNPSTRIPILENPEDLIVVVVGGPSKHSSFISTHCQSRRVTRKIVL